MHRAILIKGLETEPLIGNSLVDIYAKCGLLASALALFEKLKTPDIVSWNSLITCYSQLGDCVNALGYFQVMIGEGVHLDLFTFFSILNVCSHSGLAEDGYTFFNLISKDYFLNPSFEHYTCMVDLLGRAGCLDLAESLVETMPIPPDNIVWRSLLSTCESYSNVKLGNQCFNELKKLDAIDESAYTLISRHLCGC